MFIMSKCTVPCKPIFYYAWDTRIIYNTKVCHRMSQNNHMIEPYVDVAYLIAGSIFHQMLDLKKILFLHVLNSVSEFRMNLMWM